MNKGVFYFDFFNPETEESVVYAFNINLLNADLNEDLDTDYEYHCSDTESDYGVHDWSSRFNDEIIEFGYTSYEIEPKNYLKVMELWRKYLESRSDVQDTTDIVEIPSDEFENFDSLDVYNKVASDTVL